MIHTGNMASNRLANTVGQSEHKKRQRNKNAHMQHCLQKRSVPVTWETEIQEAKPSLYHYVQRICHSQTGEKKIQGWYTLQPMGFIGKLRSHLVYYGSAPLTGVSQ